MDKFAPGDYVKLSLKGKDRKIRKDLNITGTIAGKSKQSPDCYNVWWGDNKSTDTMHESFLERIR